MKLEYTPQAINDLKRLHDFVAGKHPLAARRIALEIREAAEKLRTFPLIGLPVARAQGSEEIRDLYSGQYTLRYRLDRQMSSDVIQILRIWHGREHKPGL